MFVEMGAAVRRSHWSQTTELLAQLNERVDALIRVTIQAHSAKPPNLGPALKIPRPAHAQPVEAKPNAVSPASFFRMIAPGKAVT